MRYNVRNWIAVAAFNRNGGVHIRSRNEQRAGQRNEQREYLDEYEYEDDINNDDNHNEEKFDCWD